MKTLKIKFDEKLELKGEEDKILNKVFEDFIPQYKVKKLNIELIKRKMNILEDERFEKIIYVLLLYKISL
jgi:hypothetical protein